MNCYFISAADNNYVLSIADNNTTPEQSQLVLNRIDGKVMQQFMLFQEGLVNAHTGLVLEALDDQVGAPIVQRELKTREEDGRQVPDLKTRWSYHYDQTLRTADGRCLTVEKGVIEDNAPVIAWRYEENNDKQKWILATIIERPEGVKQEQPEWHDEMVKKVQEHEEEKKNYKRPSKEERQKARVHRHKPKEPKPEDQPQDGDVVETTTTTTTTTTVTEEEIPQ